MKLFKNSVGRPSNETLKNRKIFIISMVALIISLVAIIISGITILIGNNNVNKLKGVATSGTFKIVYECTGCSGSMSSQTITIGEKNKLSSNKFTKSGYKFKGWHAKRIVNNKTLYRGCKTSGTCSNEDAKWLSITSIKSYFVYNDKEEVSQTGLNGETVYMIAQWEKNSSNTIKSSNSSSNSSVSSSSTGSSSVWRNIFSTGNTLINLIKKMFSEITLPTITKPTTTTTEKKEETTKPSSTSTTTTVKTTTKAIETEKRNYNTSVCSFPYSIKYCSKIGNDEKGKIAKKNVEKIQIMLNKYDSSNKLEEDGIFGEATLAAVKSFQKDLGLNQDGVVGYKELKALCSKTKTRYFNIQYYKDSKLASYSDNLKGTSKITNTSTNETKTMQTVVYEVTQNISSEVLKKDGYTHVGYIATTYYNEEKYRFGCYSTKCDTDKDADWHLDSEIKKSGKTFKSYVYSVGQEVSKTGFKYSGQKVNFTAFYCKGTNKIYDKKKSKCKKKSGYASSGNVTISRSSVDAKKYNDSSVNWVDYTKRMESYLPYVAKYANKYNVDPAIIMAIIATESRANAKATNNSGCYGLMQVMAKNTDYSGQQLYDPETNIKVGTSIYSGKYKNNNYNESKALCAYNGVIASSCTYSRTIANYKSIINKLYTISY